MLAHELRLAVRDVEVDVIEAVALDLMVDGAGDDVARRQLGALVEVGHEALAGLRDASEWPPSPRTASVIRKFLTCRL